MGYIKDQNIELTCFLTQKGKDLYLNGTEQDITITQFVLGDSDTNYQQSSNGNILTRNFIPALSGEYNECDSSSSYGINVKHMINKDPKGILISSYCTSNNTLIEKYQNPDGTVRTIETANSSKCGFMYYSNPVSKTFTPNIKPNLPFDDGSSPDLQYQRTTIDDYTVSLPYGYKTSTVSQLEADNLALNYLNTNGQSIADTNGTITYYSSGRTKENIIKTLPAIKYPYVYPKVTLNYLPEIVSSKTFNDNNIKINKIVNDTYQDLVNELPLVATFNGTFSSFDYYPGTPKNNVVGKKWLFLPIVPKIFDGSVNSYRFDFGIDFCQQINGIYYHDIVKNLYIVNSADYYNQQLTDGEIDNLNNTYTPSDKDFTNAKLSYNKSQLLDLANTTEPITEIDYNGTNLISVGYYSTPGAKDGFLPENIYDMFVVEFENPTVSRLPRGKNKPTIPQVYIEILKGNYQSPENVQVLSVVNSSSPINSPYYVKLKTP